ncbi:DUF1460 domain-containing protein [Pseudomonas lundensis]|uniref:DUF1460 domain-containing protein n=1 Tax=Serratia proteamaculans TaxID=28151 RepID=UPI002981EBF4|nr:DUF1460 domain-containing protein [Serratia proteamaculans]MDW5500807.1 DUF1460 domain-containing protein [Serratia proteamaculans]MDW5505872.1 DUF1460 domain-containing protein [Pseudomonas lundensis]
MNKVVSLILAIALSGCADKIPVGQTPEPTTTPPADLKASMDNHTLNKLNQLLALRAAASAEQQDNGYMIDLLSRPFLGTPYVANMLIGSQDTPEKLVIDFRGLDCFTYIDYVDALRQADSQADFVQRLINIRYANGDINFLQRKHFFTDWSHQAKTNTTDITATLSPHAVTLVKNLNEKADGGSYLPGLKNVQRSITYLPSEFIDDKVLAQLHTGDYIGIYTNLAGLDVTHTGIYIMTQNGPVLRNASSRKENMQVVDSPFMDYVLATPGIVVLRAK